MTNHGKLLTKHKVTWFVFHLELTLALPRSIEINGTKISFHRNIFLSQYCVSKCHVWIRPKMSQLWWQKPDPHPTGERSNRKSTLCWIHADQTNCHFRFEYSDSRENGSAIVQFLLCSEKYGVSRIDDNFY